MDHDDVALRKTLEDLSDAIAEKMLAEALAPLGLELKRITENGRGYLLRFEDGNAGYAMRLSKAVYVILSDTPRIKLAKPIARQFPMRSAADLYERLTERLSKALQPLPPKTQHLPPGTEHRDLLCIGTAQGHAAAVTLQGLVKRSAQRETWRCGTCGHDTTIPRAESIYG